MLKPIDLRAFGLMVILCSIWGGQQVLIKFTARDISPVMQVGLRSGLAVAVIFIMTLLTARPLTFRLHSLPIGVLVGVMFGAEYLLICVGLGYTTASRMVVLIYTAPLFSAVGLHWIGRCERLSALQWFGIWCAFLGVAVAFLDFGEASRELPSTLLGDCLGLMAGALWGGVTIAVRATRLSSEPPLESLVYQLLGAFIVLVLSAPEAGQERVSFSWMSVLSLSYQTLIIAFASFFTWMWLLKRYSSAGLGTLSFMTPMFGVVFGMVILAEPLTSSFVIGSILVILGVILVNATSWFHPRRRTPKIE